MVVKGQSVLKLLRSAAHAAPVIFLLAALWVLGKEIGSISADHIWSGLEAISMQQWFAALLLTGCGYAVLTLYDALGLRLLGSNLPYRTAARGAFLSFTISHNVGLGWISGTSMRQRVYGPLGVGLADVARLTVLNSITFFIGGFVLLGAVLIGEPQLLAPLVPLPRLSVQLSGAALWLAIACYLVICAKDRGPIGWNKINLPVPNLATALGQIALSSVDILLAGTVLYLLLPHDSGIGFPLLIGIYIVALGASVLTHVPGGLGVFETMILWSLPGIPRGPLLASLIAYRIVYYLVPLAIALAWMFGRASLRLAGRVAFGARALKAAVPVLTACLSLGSGLFLLVSGATPLDAHIQMLRRLVPLPLLELSHLVGSIVGLGLVLLGGALYRRYDTARNVAILLLLTGSATLLLRRQAIDGALLLGGSAAALEASASAFYRRGAFWRNAVTPGWIAAALIALGGSVWVGFRAYADVAYTHDLWWQFAYDAGAPRFLRASLLAGILGLALLAARLLGPAREGRATGELTSQVREVVAASPDTQANLALLGDKRFLHSRSGRSFLMYQVEGRTWIAMGDPVGPRCEWPELVWQFRECVDIAGGRPVFYETLGDSLALYVDTGLVAHKIGEEARVDLSAFDLASPASKPFRAVLKRGERAGLSFEIVPAADLPLILDEMETVSRDWLQAKNRHEKGFSLGAFDAAYLGEFDCAVVRQEGRIIAFGNIWLGASLHESSMDLMRHRSDAPKGTMMFLILSLMLWAQRSGCAWFNLGMAPLAGLTRHRLAPRWHAIGRIIFRHGERLYGFNGLRRFKAQFHPVWRSRYVVCRPGTITLALALADCARRISRSPVHRLSTPFRAGGGA